MFGTPVLTQPQAAGRPGPAGSSNAPILVPALVPAEPVSAWVASFGAALADVDSAVGDAELIDRIRALEEVKSAAAAAQVRAAAVLDASQRRAQELAGVPAEKRGQGVGAQVAGARRESPYHGGRHLGMAKALTAEMLRTLAALSTGMLSEWRATLLVRETACLSVADRRAADAELAADTGSLESLGDQKLIGRARAITYRLDPASVVARAAKAAADRHVSCRPAPDTMTYLTGLLPVTQGVAVYAALSRQADTLVGTGDGRGRGQIMADTLVERVTGAAVEAAAKIEVQLVMTDRTLFQGESEPAVLPGYGVVPAQWARTLMFGPGSDSSGPDTGNGPGSSGGAVAGTGASCNSDDPPAQVWLRRLYTAPSTGMLIGMESRARFLPPGLRRFIQVRDATCRTPYCDAPIRHADHIVAHARGGPTSAANAQGLCEACNLAKEAPGWTSRPLGGARHSVETTTPTGHTYQSTAPPLPGVERSSAESSNAGSSRAERSGPSRPQPGARPRCRDRQPNISVG